MYKMLLMYFILMNVIWTASINKFTLYAVCLGLLFSMALLTFTVSFILMIIKMIEIYFPNAVAFVNKYRMTNTVAKLTIPDVEKFKVVNLRSVSILLTLSLFIITFIPYFI